VRRASSRERCTSERTTRGDATRPVVYRAPGALKAPLEGDELVDRSAGPGPIGRWPNCTSRLDGLGVSFRAGPHSLNPLFALPFIPSPSPLLLTVAFLSLSLFRARGAHGSDPESSTALPRTASSPGRALSLSFSLSLSLSPSLGLSSSLPCPRILPLPRRLLLHPLTLMSLLPFVLHAET